MKKLRIETEDINVSSWGPSPDESWNFVDAAGHGHFFYHGYLTLRHITESAEDEGGTYERHVRWECPHCGEHIVPSTKPSMMRQSIPGIRRYLIDDVEVDRESLLQVYNEYELDRLRERMEEL